MYEIITIIEGGFDDLDVVCAFDPTKVVVRLQRDFPGTEVDRTDYAWRDYKVFLKMGLTEEWKDGEPTALATAANDARRRGPLWLFRIPTPDGGWVRGSAERHWVQFHSEEQIPEPLHSQLLRFIEGLRFAPCVTVRSGWDVGTEPDATLESEAEG